MFFSFYCSVLFNASYTSLVTSNIHVLYNKFITFNGNFKKNYNLDVKMFTY